MKNRNYYYKKIVKNLTDEEESQTKSDNHYLRTLYYYFGGEEVKEQKNDNYYLREIISMISNETITEKKPDNYYLKELYLYFGGTALNKRMNDLYYLQELMSLTEDTPSGLSLTLSADKTILSKYDNDKCTLTATLDGDSVSGKSIEFTVTHKDTVIASDEILTDENGVATYTYNSTGAGDIVVEANYNRESDTVLVEDCEYWNDGSHTRGIDTQSGVSFDVQNGAMVVTTTRTSERKWVYSTPYYYSNDDVMMEFESAREDETGNIIGISLHPNPTSTSMGWAGYWTAENNWNMSLNNYNIHVPHTLEKGDIIRFVREQGYTSLYHNDDLIQSEFRSISSFRFGGYTNNGRLQRLKNIKIKRL